MNEKRGRGEIPENQEDAQDPKESSLNERELPKGSYPRKKDRQELKSLEENAMALLKLLKQVFPEGTFTRKEYRTNPDTNAFFKQTTGLGKIGTMNWLVGQKYIEIDSSGRAHIQK
jgi:hypothetical protein